MLDRTIANNKAKTEKTFTGSIINNHKQNPKMKKNKNLDPNKTCSKPTLKTETEKAGWNLRQRETKSREEAERFEDDTSVAVEMERYGGLKWKWG